MYPKKLDRVDEYGVSLNILTSKKKKPTNSKIFKCV